ncbi:MAG: hypothetical protein H0T89_15300 [Deltaproteobacteria bacterium]|nr:hypothetical protein [Deltaproteobacteria bacterium]
MLAPVYRRGKVRSTNAEIDRRAHVGLDANQHRDLHALVDRVVAALDRERPRGALHEHALLELLDLRRTEPDRIGEPIDVVAAADDPRRRRDAGWCHEPAAQRDALQAIDRVR